MSTLGGCPNCIMSSPSVTDASISANWSDPELRDLPAPRRPWRRITLALLSLTALCSLAMLMSLGQVVQFALSSRPPVDIGNLRAFEPTEALVNSYVRAQGKLEDKGGIGFERPLERDSYRLVPIAGNHRVWVQLQVPAGYDTEHFVPPVNFAGRLLPLARAGLRFSALRTAMGSAGWQPDHLPADAWLLLDGETPASTRWSLGAAALMAAFFGFCVWALISLLRPLRPEAARPDSG